VIVKAVPEIQLFFHFLRFVVPLFRMELNPALGRNRSGKECNQGCRNCIPQKCGHDLSPRYLSDNCSFFGTYHLMKLCSIPAGAGSTPLNLTLTTGSANGTYRNV